MTPVRRRAEGLGNMMAASLGIVTPFYSCSAVPLLIGFVQAGVPLGVTFSFPIAAPMVNEVAPALFGRRIALLAKGAALGTILAFMMSVIALSLPEMAILRKVLKLRLIAAFVGVVAAGIVVVGCAFNVLAG